MALACLGVVTGRAGRFANFSGTFPFQANVVGVFAVGIAVGYSTADISLSY